jgi:uncharacterized protein YbjT (DUF2867 family)
MAAEGCEKDERSRARNPRRLRRAMALVAADDVAATVTDLAVGAPVGGRVELGGPEALGIDDWARRPFRHR